MHLLAAEGEMAALARRLGWHLWVHLKPKINWSAGIVPARPVEFVSCPSGGKMPALHIMCELQISHATLKRGSARPLSIEHRGRRR